MAAPPFDRRSQNQESNAFHAVHVFSHGASQGGQPQAFFFDATRAEVRDRCAEVQHEASRIGFEIVQEFGSLAAILTHSKK